MRIGANPLRCSLLPASPSPLASEVDRALPSPSPACDPEWLSSPGAGSCRGSFAAGGKKASGVRWRYIITREEPVPDPSHLGRSAHRHAQSGWKNASAALGEAALVSGGDCEAPPGFGSRGAKNWEARARSPSELGRAHV